MISAVETSELFAEKHGTEPRAIVFAPGRINLIGEHIDYAGGHVLPVALHRGVSVAARPTMEPLIRVFSSAYADAGVLEISPYEDIPDGFGAFVQAAAAETGMHSVEIVITSDLPLETGLSSSAALCIALTAALAAVSAAPVVRNNQELIRRAQRVEKRASGVECGIMDQYASLYGRQGSAILVDTQNFTHEPVPLGLDESVFICVDSGQPRDLAGSGYNERRAELERAMTDYKKLVGEFDSFRDLDPHAMLANLLQLDDVSLKRLRHVVTEQQRVVEFVGALGRNDIDTLGMLLAESHNSLRDDYQASTAELDQLVAQLGAQAGVLGARLTGGGFGGSVLALISRGAMPERVEAALAQYRQLTGLEAGWNQVTAGDGAKIWLGTGEPVLVADWLK